MPRVTILIPDELLERVDAEVTRRATTRGALIQRALEAELERRDPDRVRESLRAMQEIGSRWPSGATSERLLAQEKLERDAHGLRKAETP